MLYAIMVERIKQSLRELMLIMPEIVLEAVDPIIRLLAPGCPTRNWST
jgi:hypothetical protein